MVHSCSAYGCTNRYDKNKNVSFHSFPKNAILLKKWLIVMKRKDFLPGKYAKLCSAHFLPQDFIINFGKKTLKPDACPSMFNFPDHLTRKPTVKRSTRLEVTEIQVTPSTLVQTTTSNGDPSSQNIEVTFLANDTVQGTSENCSLDISGNNSVSCQNTLLGKRKRKVPAYLGDATIEDFQNPAKMRRLWQIANKTISNQKHKIKYLQTKLRRSYKKIQTLQDLVTHLREINKITPECQAILKVCLETVGSCMQKVEFLKTKGKTIFFG